METRYRIYVTDPGQFKNEQSYEYVAEFVDARLTHKFSKEMRADEKWKKKDIIVRQVNVEDHADFVRTIVVLSTMGEYLPLDQFGIK